MSTIEIIEDLFKALVWDSIVEVKLAALLALIPGINVPVLGIVIGIVVGYGFRWAANWAFSALRLFINMDATAIKNEVHRKAFDAAALKLRVIATDEGVTSPRFIEERENAKKSLAQFVHFGL